jgi:hypothetical protein
MNHQGLYWPTGRNLFRQRPHTGRRMALWTMSAAALLTVVLSLYLG